MRAKRRFEKPIKAKNEVETFFRCESCGEEFDTRALAASCCCTWECAECGCDFDEKSEAADCCATWMCSECEDEFDTKEEAVACCK